MALSEYRSAWNAATNSASAGRFEDSPFVIPLIVFCFSGSVFAEAKVRAQAAYINDTPPDDVIRCSYSGSDPGALLLTASMATGFAPGAAAMATACHFRLLPVLTAHLLPEGSQATTW